MENILKLEALKQNVETLWASLQSVSGPAQGSLREQYRAAYEAYRRQLAWVSEMSRQQQQAS